MSTRVEPIRDRRKISTIKKLLRGGAEIRDYVLFTLGINLGLRVGDLLKLTIKDVFDIDNQIRDTFEIVEEKTNKQNVIFINDESRKALQLLVEREPAILEKRSNRLIFNTRNKYQKISRVQAYKLVKKWCEEVGIKEMAVGTHTLRKTWGYQAHKQGIPIEVIQEKYKHNTTSTTRHYLGIEQKDVNDAYHKVNL